MKDQKLKFMPIEPSSAPEKARMRSTEKSNIGRRLNFSASRKAAKLRMATPRMARPAGLPKPRSGPWVM